MIKPQEAIEVLDKFILFKEKLELPEMIDIKYLIHEQEIEIEELKEALKCNRKSK